MLNDFIKEYSNEEKLDGLKKEISRVRETMVIDAFRLDYWSNQAGVDKRAAGNAVELTSSLKEGTDYLGFLERQKKELEETKS